MNCSAEQYGLPKQAYGAYGLCELPTLLVDIISDGALPTNDAVHDLLGIHGQTLQSQYRFTLGGALSDPRLQTLAAYIMRRSARCMS